MHFYVRLLITAAALWVATQVIGGITYAGGALGLIGVALLFGIVNAVLGSVFRLFAFPFIILTLGLLALIINGVLLLITSSLAGSLGIGFHVAGFGSAFWGAIVISLVTALLSRLFRHDKPRVTAD
ncbi:MAG: phage holin family protein [Gemmatimonadaceae bacterium]